MSKTSEDLEGNIGARIDYFYDKNSIKGPIQLEFGIFVFVYLGVFPTYFYLVLSYAWFGNIQDNIRILIHKFC